MGNKQNVWRYSVQTLFICFLQGDAPAWYESVPLESITDVLTGDDVPPMTAGFGRDGAQVQLTLHHPDLNDRTVLRKTFLSGLLTIPWRGMCSRMRSLPDAQKKKYHFPKKQWEMLMKAALEQSPIARLQHDGTPNACVVMRPIPTDEEEQLAYHNELMRLCRLPLRDFSFALRTEHDMAIRRAAAPPDDSADQDLVSQFV